MNDVIWAILWFSAYWGLVLWLLSYWPICWTA